MNQILVTEKLYVTPELKRKKKIYKFNFFISVFLVCILFSYYIYAEYERTKDEDISHEILAQMDTQQEVEENPLKLVGDSLVIVVDEEEADRQEIDVTDLAKEVEQQIEQNQELEHAAEKATSEEVETVILGQQVEQEVHTASNGETYTTDSILNIPSLGINYPVLSQTSEALLKISVNKFWGGNPNEVGNYVIVGHNYRNKKMFGKLSQIKNGDICELTDLAGRTIKYSVYDTYVVNPDDVACTSQKTDGKKEITLITCTNSGQQRFIVKAREVK